MIGKNDSTVGGMNRSHRLSQGAKKVTPPSIPSFSNPRGSGSSFGSDLSYSEREDSNVSNHPMSTFSRAPNGESSSSSPAFTKLTFEADVIPRRGSLIPKSPGRDSPGDESSASIATVESVSSGCRNSTTSLDSGRASNSNSASDSGLPPVVSTFHTIHEHRPMVNVPQHTASHGPQPPRLSSIGSASSFRQSYHSSTSSLGSMDRAHEDSICALDINEMLANGVPDQEVLLAWLTDLHFEDYYDLFASAGYDMHTIKKMTPEDLTAIGVKKPNHRKKLKADIVKLTIGDGLPNYIPPTLDEFLHLVRLMEYRGLLANQGYLTIDDLTQISIEDLEDVGIYRLGHQKRLLLSIKRAKDLKSGRRIAQYPTSAAAAAAASAASTASATSQNNHSVGAPNNIVRPVPFSKPPPPPPGGMSSFQALPTAQSANSRGTPTKMDNYHHRSLVYQPEVIRIERAPSLTSVVRPPSCSPSPPPPPPPQNQHQHLVTADINTLGMPQPMPPLATSFQRYQPSFQYPQPPSWISSNMASGPRSFDDVDIALSNRRNPERVLMHQHSASNLAASGGTLPRLGKGFVQPNKQRPVAKIMAKTREQPATANSMISLSDYDPKSMKEHDQFMMQLKGNSELERNNQTGEHGIGVAREGEQSSFPFANDNVGTIRMRSNSHVQAMLDESADNAEHHNSQYQNGNSEDIEHATSQQQHQKNLSDNNSGGQRTAGDVLNDIGSMLADLTDELDAMLHMDPNQAAGGNGSAAAGFSKA